MLYVNIRTGSVVSEVPPKGSRDSSRTLSQAFGYIAAALGNPGMKLQIKDHSIDDLRYRHIYVSRGVNEHLADRISRLAEDTGVVGLTLESKGADLFLVYEPYVPLSKVIKEWKDGKGK